MHVGLKSFFELIFIIRYMIYFHFISNVFPLTDQIAPIPTMVLKATMASHANGTTSSITILSYTSIVENMTMTTLRQSKCVVAVKTSRKDEN